MKIILISVKLGVEKALKTVLSMEFSKQKEDNQKKLTFFANNMAFNNVIIQTNILATRRDV